jgi:hypothetical protein
VSDKLKTALKTVGALGIKVTGLPALKNGFPKTKLGALVDSYHDIREVRLALTKVAAAVEEHEKAMLEHIIENVSADEGGVVGKRYKGIIKRETIPVVEDWDKFYEHIRKTRGFDLLNKALNRAAFKERFEAGKAVPGCGTFQAKKLSVTKV